MVARGPRRRRRDVYARWRGTQAGGLTRDSAYVAVYQGATTVADLLQLVVITHVLGLEEYGRLALAMAAVLVIGQLFDLRVGVAATVFGARRLQDDPGRSAGVFQFTYLVDGATGVVGFAIVAALAPLIGPALVGEDGTLLMLLFAITLLASTVDESSFSILRLFDRFPLIAASNTTLELARIAVVVIAVLTFESLVAVVLATVAVRGLGGVVNTWLAARTFKRVTGGSLWRPALDQAADVRSEMWRMMLHTNVVSYARLAQTHLPTVLIGALASPLQVGSYKVGMGAAVLIAKLGDPAYTAILPRLARLWSDRAYEALRRLIRTVALVSLPALALAALILIVLREPALNLLGGGEAAASAQTVLVLGALAHGVNSGLFWNGGLLFAVGRAAFVSRLSVFATVLQVVLLVPLVAAWGADGAALALLITFVVINLIGTRAALQVLRSPPQPQQDPRCTSS